MEYRKLYRNEIKELVAACKLIGHKKLTSSVGGNLSYRVSAEHILVTPTNMPKELVEEEDICVIDYNGNLVEAREGVEPTSEKPFHTMIMRMRPEIVSAVHAHSTALCAFAITKYPWLEKPFFPEPIMEIGPIVTIPYAEPSCDKLADEMEKYIHRSNGFVLQNHGALALSAVSPLDAVEKLYMMESVATSIYMAVTMGDPKLLTGNEVMEIEHLQKEKGLETKTDPISAAFVSAI